MKLKALILCSLAFAVCTNSVTINAEPKNKGEKGKISLSDVTNGKFYGKNLNNVQMLSDNKFTALDYDLTHYSTVILRYDFERDLPDTLFNSFYAQGFTPQYIAEDYALSTDGNYLLLAANSESMYRHSSKAEYIIYSLRKNKVKTIMNGKKISDCTFSPNNELVAFIYENNLYYQNFKTGEIVQVTKDGKKNAIINGMADWVYEEEFSLTHAYDWSPNSDKLAWQRFDESKVKEYSLTVYDADSSYPRQLKYKYPKAGDENSKVGVYVYEFANAKTTKLRVGEENDQYIPRIKWTNSNTVLSIFRMNRRQNSLEVLYADLTKKSIEVVFEDENNTYIDLPESFHILKNNDFIISSERTGWNNLFLVDQQGTVLRNLTNYQHDVVKLVAVDETAQRLYYNSYEPTPLYNSVFEIGLDGTGRRFVSQDWQRGTNTIQFSPDFKYYLLTTSAIMSPTVVTAFKNDGFKIREVILNTELRDLIKTYEIAPKQEIKFKLNADVELNGWVIKPANFKESKDYPVIFTVYGGPGRNTVVNNYDPQDFWYQYLAQQGYVIISVDPHGTAGRGADFKRATYKRLGSLESDEFIACAKYLVDNNKWADKDRIGIFGWSFGGTMASTCITKGGTTFKSAVAVAPVTDWRYYDNIYTERYMQKPSENPDGYKLTNVYQHVPKMTGNLLLIHGTLDDNVHPQNSMVLISELIKNGKKFDSELYPNKNHSIYGGNTRTQLFERITEYFLNNL